MEEEAALGETGRGGLATGDHHHHHHHDVDDEEVVQDNWDDGDDEDDEGEDYDDFTDIAFIFDAVLPEVPHRELLSNHLEENKHMREFFYFFVKITKNLFL